jgi:dCMP deaminase
MKDEAKATDLLFREAGKYIIIGLTGRTGSGCSASAKILSENNIYIPSSSGIYIDENDSKKYCIVKNYIGDNWRPFISIQVRAIITGVLLRLEYEDFVGLINEIVSEKKEGQDEKLYGFKGEWDNAFKKVSDFEKIDDGNIEERAKKKEEALYLYLDYLPVFCDKLKDYLKENIGPESYTALYQKVGDNIRASGLANCSDFDERKLFTIPKIIWHLIKAIKNKNSEEGACITIDAIRNPFEAIYFQQRYSSFYLISINTPNEVRLSHLRKDHKLSDHQIAELDNKEYPKKLAGKEIYIYRKIFKSVLS